MICYYYQCYFITFCPDCIYMDDVWSVWMKDWLIKKLGGFTRDEYIKGCITANEPQVVTKSVYSVKTYDSLLEFYNGEENRFTSEDIRYELMRNLIPLLMNKIKVTKNFDINWNRVVYRGELMIAEDE